MISRRGWWCALAVLMTVLGACRGEDDARGLAGPPRADGGTGTGGGDSGGAAASGLPCDVAAVVSAHCTSCHGGTPIGGAPMSLVTYENLTAPSLTRPSESMVVRSVARMQDTVAPMPPGATPTATSADIATLEAWIAAGTPRGTCTNPTDPFGTPVMCTSGTHWTSGDLGSELMYPGRACLGCHDSLPAGTGPDFPMTIGGTVYPSAHEPDDCNGASESSTGSAITVEVRGHDGSVQMLQPNEAGNFLSFDPIALPVTALVHYQGRTRTMVGEVASADCNTCHTESGASSAPGRILLP